VCIHFLEEGRAIHDGHERIEPRHISQRRTVTIAEVKISATGNGSLIPELSTMM